MYAKNSVLRFNYTFNRNGFAPRFVKVLSVRDTKKNPVAHRNKLAYNWRVNNHMARSRYYVTAIDTIGTVRVYYMHDDMNTKKCSIVGRLWFKVCTLACSLMSYFHLRQLYKATEL